MHMGEWRWRDVWATNLEILESSEPKIISEKKIIQHAYDHLV